MEGTEEGFEGGDGCGHEGVFEGGFGEDGGENGGEGRVGVARGGEVVDSGYD